MQLIVIHNQYELVRVTVYLSRCETIYGHTHYFSTHTLMNIFTLADDSFKVSDLNFTTGVTVLYSEMFSETINITDTTVLSPT